MTKEMIGLNCYLFYSKDNKKIKKQKEIEKRKYNATITERFVNNAYAFESKRARVIM